MPNQCKESAVSFLMAATAYLAKLGVHVERVMTDNGPCRRSKTSAPPANEEVATSLHETLHAEDKRKAKQFIQTALREGYGKLPELRLAIRRAAQLAR